MMKSFFADPSDELIGKIERQIPARSLADVGDVAYAILFLASDESKFMNGAQLRVDNAMSVASGTMPE